MKQIITKIGVVLLASAAALTFTACDDNVVKGTMTDSRDGKTYKTVKIGDKVWMAENLNYKTSESKCYENKPENCEKYGRLYDLKATLNACPDGWHMPSEEEFKELVVLAGRKVGEDNPLLASNRAGTVLKSKTGWRLAARSVDGIDGFGFGALPAGRFHHTCDSCYSFYDGGDLALFWADPGEYFNAVILILHYGNEYAEREVSFPEYGHSIRCVQDSNEVADASSQRSQTQPESASVGENAGSRTMTDSRDGKTYKTVKIGEQVWMAENLNYKNNGSLCYGNKDVNCEKFGRLYTWVRAMTACPAGWHLPSKNEFETLLDYVGEKVEESNKTALDMLLKSDRKVGQSKNLRAVSWENGMDRYGFSALPAGTYYRPNKSFHGMGASVCFWSSENTGNSAYNLYIDESGAGIDNNSTSDSFSVRCLKD